MKAWSIAGSTDLAPCPRGALSVVSDRQPRKVCPSSATIFSNKAIPEDALLGVRRREEDADAIFARLRLRHAEGPAPFGEEDFAEELVGDLNQDPGAVAGVVFPAARPPVVEVFERLQPVSDDLVRFPPVDVGDEAQAAGVVLVAGVV